MDANGRAITWLKTLYKDRTVKILQDNEKKLIKRVKKSISKGDILILYDEACYYDRDAFINEMMHMLWSVTIL